MIVREYRVSRQEYTPKFSAPALVVPQIAAEYKCHHHAMIYSGSAVVVLTTLGAGTEAVELARALVEEGLAACVNVLPPMRSVYRWKGAVEVDTEQQVVIKTTAAGVAALEARLRALHPYELPEFLVLTAGGSEAYLRWVAEAVAGRS
jgi:periplasmic divalent cation tolerance protein